MTSSKNLHSRNRHNDLYDFQALCKAHDDLCQYVRLNDYHQESLDFSLPQAVVALNKAILKHFYNVKEWVIPVNALCPPIPGRADYIHYMAELLGYPKGPEIKVLDIGVGASCIYPLIGEAEYGWSFVGSEINPESMKSAENIIKLNEHLKNKIEIRQQKNAQHTFKDIIKPTDFFHLTICNPPFHSSLEEATEGSKRKWKNLKGVKNSKPVLNFGGEKAELWCEGGEFQFIKNMVEESVTLTKKVLWFSSLVSKVENLDDIYRILKKAKVSQVRTLDMIHGQKKTRIVAWTYFEEKELNEKLRSLPH